MAQQLAMAAYRTPFVKPQSTAITSLLFPVVTAQDSAPPGYSAQLLAQAAYRQPSRNPVFIAPNAAVLDYYEADASVGQDSIQMLAWSAYRPAFVAPQKPYASSVLFPPIAPQDVVPGQSMAQQKAQAAYRSPFVSPTRPILNTGALFPQAPGGGFFARYYYDMTAAGIHNV